MNKYYTIFELVIENTPVRHEPTYHNGIEVSSLVIYTCVKLCSIHLLQFITVHNTIASGVIAESLRRSPFSLERPAPPGQWKCKLKCTISIAVAQRLRYIVSYGILSHSHSICIAFVLYCIALYGTTLYDKL